MDYAVGGHDVSTERAWLGGRLYDLGFLILPGFLCLLLVIPYRLIGASVVMPIYTLYLVGFGLPHNYLTWATILPKASRRGLDTRAIAAQIFVALITCGALYFSLGTPVADWILSAIAVLSIWHVYRQHHGIAKIYDAIQARREGDPRIFGDRELLSEFFGLASFGVLVWVFTHPGVRFLMSSDEDYAFVHPLVSRGTYHLYLALTATTGILGIKRAFFDRARAGLSLPWPQLALILSALASFWVPYLFLPISAMPLAMAIATIFHNIQYFAFVWLYERAQPSPKPPARENRWKTFLAVALLFSLGVVTLYGILPRKLGTFVIYFIGVSHYLVDGVIWKARRNRNLGPTLSRIASQVSHFS